MSSRIEFAAGSAHGRNVYLGDEKPFFPILPAGYDPTERFVYHCVARIDPFVLVRKQISPVRKIFGNIRSFQRGGAANNPAAAFAGDMLHRG